MSIKSKLTQLSPLASKVIATKSKLIAQELDKQLSGSSKDSAQLMVYTMTASFSDLSDHLKLNSSDVEDIFMESKSIENLRKHFKTRGYILTIEVSEDLVARFNLKRAIKKKKCI